MEGGESHLIKRYGTRGATLGVGRAEKFSLRAEKLSRAWKAAGTQ